MGLKVGARAAATNLREELNHLLVRTWIEERENNLASTGDASSALGIVYDRTPGERVRWSSSVGDTRT